MESFLLSLPFVKVIYDFVRGLPPESVLLNGLDPFSLAAKQQLLQIGFGISYLGPKFSVVFSVRDMVGKEFATSMGDYALMWLNRYVGTYVPLIVLTVALAVALSLLFMRIISAVRFELRRRMDRAQAKTFRVERTGFRTVDIYISERFSGSPFTGGVLGPYICIPKEAFDR